MVEYNKVKNVYQFLSQKMLFKVRINVQKLLHTLQKHKDLLSNEKNSIKKNILEFEKVSFVFEWAYQT